MLIYKKVLFDLNTSGTPELNDQKEDDFKKKYEKVAIEINEVIGASKGDPEINAEVIKELDGAFGEMLLRYPEKLNALKRGVNRIKNNPEYKEKAGNVLNNLDDFLNSISVLERNQNNYKDFMERIKKPSRLNGLSDDEVSELISHLETNDSDALEAYIQMKPIKGKFKENGMKGTDQRYFNEVWSSLEDKYKDNDSFIDKDFPGFKNLNSNVNSLKTFANMVYGSKSSWIGDDFLKIFKKEDSIVNTDNVKEKFNKFNKERIDSVNNSVNSIIGALSINNLKIENNIIKIIDGDNSKNFDFKSLVIDENNEVIEGLLTVDEIDKIHFENIKKGWEEKLEKRIKDSNEHNENNLNGGFDKKVNKVGDRMDQERVDKIKESAGDNEFLKLEDGNLKYNLENVRKFLGTINENNFKDYYTKPGEAKRYAWLAATQILLGEMNNNLTVDGEYVKNGDTYKAVKKFQEDYNNMHAKDKNFKYLVTDGIPGPITLSKMLELETTATAEIADSAEKHNVEVDQVTETGNEIGENIINKLKLKNFDVFDNLRIVLNIPKDVVVYTNFDVDKDGYYYIKDNKIVRASDAEPWIKKSIDISKFNADVSQWSVELDVYDRGKNILNTNLKDMIDVVGDVAVSITISDSEPKQYILNNGDVKIPLNDILIKDFCGQNKIEDKLKLVCLASELKQERFNINNGDDFNKLEAKVSSYGLEQFNRDEFLSYYKSLFI